MQLFYQHKQYVVANWTASLLQHLGMVEERLIGKVKGEILEKSVNLVFV